MIKNLTKIFALVVMAGTFLSCNGFAQEGQTPTITKTFKLDKPGTLYSKSSGGSIEVVATNSNEVIIQAFVRKNSTVLDRKDPMVKEILEDFELKFEQEGTEIYAIVKRVDHFNVWKNVGISLKVIVPKEMSCNVSSSGGSVKVDGVDGKHKISSSGGSVRLENISGYTEAKSSGGSLKVFEAKGEIYVSSSGGGVTVENVQGDVHASSSGGGVKLNNIHGDVDASSSGGGVSITGKAENVKAKSSGGGVHADIYDLNKSLYLQSSGGGVSATIHDGDKLGLDLDLRAGKVNVNLKNFSGSAEKNRVNGSMNGGGIPVYMHASGGNVNLQFND